MKITIVAGARPNFIKVAPIIHAIQKRKHTGASISYRLVHTGQHYDRIMSDVFFEQLEIPMPDVNLESGGGTQAQQTANIMVRFEKELLMNPVDLVLVVGDVTSTMACAITAQKLGVKVAHVEAGIRSGDWSMPEEINRLVTDSITNYFFTTSSYANSNLERSGVDMSNVFWVGNVMIDTLLKNREKFSKPKIWDDLSLIDREYLVLTLHRPSNVDDEWSLHNLLSAIVSNANGLPIIFPVHPRTKEKLKNSLRDYNNIHLIEPLNYFEFNFLTERTAAVITDSGGITEEASVLRVPCVTLRNSTERPETVELGTNELVGSNPDKIGSALNRIFLGKWKSGSDIPYWDGKSAERIVEVLIGIQ